jgi:hypothetical protein
VALSFSILAQNEEWLQDALRQAEHFKAAWEQQHGANDDPEA